MKTVTETETEDRADTREIEKEKDMADTDKTMEIPKAA